MRRRGRSQWQQRGALCVDARFPALEDHDDLPPELNRLTGQIVQAIGDVRAELGAGLLERAYQVCLAEELLQRGFAVALEREVPLSYKGHLVPIGFRADMIVEESVIVECKAVTELAPVHKAQVLTYLRLTGS